MPVWCDEEAEKSATSRVLDKVSERLTIVFGHTRVPYSTVQDSAYEDTSKASSTRLPVVSEKEAN